MAVSKTRGTFPIGRLKSLLDEKCSSSNVLDTLVSNGRTRVLASFGAPGLSPTETACWIAVIAKAIQCETHKAKVIDLLNMVLGTKFFTREITKALSSFADSSKKSEGDAILFIQNLVDVVQELLLRFPHSFTDVFGHIVIVEKRLEEMRLTMKDIDRQKLKSVSSVVSSLKENLLKKMTVYDKNKSKSEKMGPPPEDFCTLSILPSTSDIFVNSRKVYLRENKARGGYENLEHYLDVQFRLYREDCISPLRDGVNEYVRAVSSGENIGRLQDGKLYKKIVAVSKKSTIEGEQYVIKLDKDHCSRINWMSSKRLIYGSLVCLSVNNFRDIHFGVVSESDRKDLQKSRKFSIVCPCNDVLPIETEMTMVESSAYYEAYRHVLAGLQNIKEGELPFEKYIVKCRKDVDPPVYVTKPPAEYDLQPIISGQPIYKEKNRYRRRFGEYADDVDKEAGKQHNVKILLPISTWPKAEELNLDQSQFEAYHAALTQEFVLIQGPPGTGKTHVGLQIAKTLLHNKSAWETDKTKPKRFRDETKYPMLVVCFTNHALDQFMEGIVNFLDQNSKSVWKDVIVRVGGRSDNTAVEQFSLKYRRRYFRRGGVNDNEYFRSVQKIQQDIANKKYILGNLHSVILGIKFLQSVMPDRLYKCLQMKNTYFEWLGADEMSWIQGAEMAYYLKLQTLYTQPAEQNTWERENNQELLQVKTDAEILEDDRRIEDDTLVSFEVDTEIGLDVRTAISNMLQEDSEVCKTLQMDDLFKTLVTQEAMKTFTRLTSQETMTEREATAYSNPSNLKFLSLDDRWRLYRYWVQKYKALQEEQLLQLDKELSQVLKDYQKEKQYVDARVLKTATVIAMTTTGAARYQDVLKEIGPKIVIVEEAAEVLETHIVTALSPKCEHLILIGDHKQLEPKPSVYRLEQEYNLGLSMFERMLNNGIENHCLQRQHRMRPEISRLVRDIYPSLEDNENVFKYEHILGIETDVFFINHNKPEDYGGDTRSYSNKHEATYVVALCRYLLKQGYAPTQITVLAAYSGQMLCIRNLMPRSEFEGVRAVAIDNFQGEETDIIILSLVRSNKKGIIGFLKKENRICVALSRAKKGLYVIGDFTILEAGCHLWAKVIKKTKSFSQFGNALPLVCQNHPQTRTLAADAEDFKKSPDGGCHRKCDFRLCCGHVCRLFCHPIDKMHTEYTCKETCTKTCHNGHPCRKTCHFDKDCKCPILVKKDLQCGHKATMKCHFPAEEYKCTVPVEKTLPCGHVLTLPCNTKPESIKCKVLVKRTLERCGHDATMECFVDPEEFKCRISVTHTLARCGHNVTLECHEDVMVYQCKQIVTRELTCKHTAELECWINVAHHECTVMLHKYREECGHSFDVVCSKYSQSYESENPCRTITSKIFPICQHAVDVACSVDINNETCKTVITKQWDCQHKAKLECWTSKEAKCNQKCLRKCENGHICYRECHYPEQCNCKRLMDKTMPNCFHIQKMKCNTDPGSVDCTEIVTKELPRCSHMERMPCHQDPSTFACIQIVNKPLIPCGHLHELPCSTDVSTIKCMTIVSKRIESCGHSQDMACSFDPSNIKCTSMVDKVLPQCGHISKLKCSADPKNHDCDKIVNKKLLCGHEIKMKCSKSPSPSTRCQVTVRMSRPACGHDVDIECSKKASINKQKCHEKILQQLICGHERSVECWKSANQQPCQKRCSVVLSCGHQCRGKCKNCSVNMFHEICEESCNKTLICGHSCNNTKCGTCRPCNDQCKNYCPHRHCEHSCKIGCRPCQEKCTLVCPHHQCSRLCFEQCGRPRCDRRCTLLLDCQHQCLGFCGDPCPKSCIKCGNNNQEKISNKPLSEATRLVSLVDCGHEFDSDFLDMIMDGKANPLDILRCPKCKEIVRWHPRYANALKIQREAIDSVKTFLNMRGSFARTSFPKSAEEIRTAVMYVTRFNTYLYIQKKLHHGTTDVRLLTQWAMSFTQQFGKLVNSSQTSLDLTSQQVECINSNMCKLSAVWLLIISSHWLNRSESSREPKVDTRTTGQISDHQRVERNTEEHKTLRDAESFIRTAHTFTPSNLQYVRKMLEPLLTNASEANIAVDFPVLVSVGVHGENWNICDKGHFIPSHIWSKRCSECSNESQLKQAGMNVGGACSGVGSKSGQNRFNEESMRGRDGGPRGRGRGREKEEKVIDSEKKMDPGRQQGGGNRGGHKESGRKRNRGRKRSSSKETGKECGKSEEGLGRGRAEQLHNSTNSRRGEDNKEHALGRDRGSSDKGGSTKGSRKENKGSRNDKEYKVEDDRRGHEAKSRGGHGRGCDCGDSGGTKVETCEKNKVGQGREYSESRREGSGRGRGGESKNGHGREREKANGAEGGTDSEEGSCARGIQGGGGSGRGRVGSGGNGGINEENREKTKVGQGRENSKRSRGGSGRGRGGGRGRGSEGRRGAEVGSESEEGNCVRALRRGGGSGRGRGRGSRGGHRGGSS